MEITTRSTCCYVDVWENRTTLAFALVTAQGCHSKFVVFTSPLLSYCACSELKLCTNGVGLGEYVIRHTEIGNTGYVRRLIYHFSCLNTNCLNITERISKLYNTKERQKSGKHTIEGETTGPNYRGHFVNRVQTQDIYFVKIHIVWVNTTTL